MNYISVLRIVRVFFLDLMIFVFISLVKEQCSIKTFFLAFNLIESIYIDTAYRNNNVATCMLYVIHVGHCTVCESNPDT